LTSSSSPSSPAPPAVLEADSAAPPGGSAIAALEAGESLDEAPAAAAGVLGDGAEPEVDLGPPAAAFVLAGDNVLTGDDGLTGDDVLEPVGFEEPALPPLEGVPAAPPAAEPFLEGEAAAADDDDDDADAAATVGALTGDTGTAPPAAAGATG